MSDRKSPGTALSLTQSLKLVRWDYHPEAGTEATMSVAAGTFFHDFPWDSDKSEGGEDREQDE